MGGVSGVVRQGTSSGRPGAVTFRSGRRRIPATQRHANTARSPGLPWREQPFHPRERRTCTLLAAQDADPGGGVSEVGSFDATSGDITVRGRARAAAGRLLQLAMRGRRMQQRGAGRAVVSCSTCVAPLRPRPSPRPPGAARRPAHARPVRRRGQRRGRTRRSRLVSGRPPRGAAGARHAPRRQDAWTRGWLRRALRSCAGLNE
jgi:hypothetical protein